MLSMVNKKTNKIKSIEQGQIFKNYILIVDETLLLFVNC